MKFISNRGNIDKKATYFQNKPVYVDLALQYGYECKVDVWVRDGELWLGHDAPRYKVNDGFLERDGIWCLAKNINTLEKLLRKPHIHCFWMSYWVEQDGITLTSRQIPWSIDSQNIGTSFIFETDMFDIDGDIPDVGGICCNNIKFVREKYIGDELPLYNMSDARDLSDIVPEHFFANLPSPK